MSNLDTGLPLSPAERLRLSVSHLLLGRGNASLLWWTSSDQTPKAMWFAAVVLMAGMSLGCNQSSTNRSTGDSATSPAQTSPVPRTAFERDLQFIRNGKFSYVWVFSRQDGKPLDKDDAAYLRSNAPQVIDWASEDPTRVVAGTNFDLEQGNLPLLRKRFVVEDYTGR